MLTRGQSIAARFLTDLARGSLRQPAQQELAELPPLLRVESDHLGVRVGEATRFYALCERAWVVWARLALEEILLQDDLEAPVARYDPPQVRDAHEAAEAARRCVSHARLLTTR